MRERGRSCAQVTQKDFDHIICAYSDACLLSPMMQDDESEFLVRIDVL